MTSGEYFQIINNTIGYLNRCGKVQPEYLKDEYRLGQCRGYQDAANYLQKLLDSELRRREEKS